MSNWIDIKDEQPPLRKDILVVAKIGYHYSKDAHPTDIFLGYFVNKNEGFKHLKIEPEFIVNCGCSGREFDTEDYEVLYWQYPPKKPEGL